MDLNTLSALLFSAATFLSPKIDRARLERAADDMALAVSLHETPFPGPAGDVAAGLALVAIGKHESGYLEDVRICKMNGDNGRSVSYFQLMRGAAWAGATREEICPSGPLAAWLALRVLNLYPAKCTDKRPQALFNAYAAGSCAAASQAATDICAIWERVSAHAGLVGASCKRRRDIRFGVPAAPVTPSAPPAAPASPAHDVTPVPVEVAVREGGPRG
jgi:hypothetical protein